jgi:CRP-like cAMP-binding protein
MPSMNNLIPPPELKAELERLATIIFKPAGSLLFRRGDDASGVFVIHSGRVRLVLDYNTALYPAKILGPGAVIGLPATLSGKPYSLTATVIDDAEIAFVPHTAVVKSLKNNPPLCFQVMDILSCEIADIRSAFKRGGSAVRAA